MYTNVISGLRTEKEKLDQNFYTQVQKSTNTHQTSDDKIINKRPRYTIPEWNRLAHKESLQGFEMITCMISQMFVIYCFGRFDIFRRIFILDTKIRASKSALKNLVQLNW